MSQTSSDKFLYFTVGLLKGSAALDALREDATKYHMIDHPGQLIALRLTEYYERMNEDSTQPSTPAVKLSPEPGAKTAGHEQTAAAETHAPQRPVGASFPPPALPSTNVQPQPGLGGQNFRLPADAHTPSSGSSESVGSLSQLSGKMRILHRDNENVVSVSSAADQNADEAADYWSTL
jgi:hypothetical protein